MNTKTLKAMADRLQELADGAEPSNPDCGICIEIARFFDYVIDHSVDFVCRTSESWPEFSGATGYPVPHPKLEPIDAYYYYLEGDRWSGEYGAARRRLCGFLAQKIREEIGNETN